MYVKFTFLQENNLINI